MGHQLTGRWLIDPIEQCRGAARAPLVPEVKGFIAAVGDKAEGDAHAGFSGDFMFGTRTETGQKIQRGRLQAGLFAAWFVVLHAELESVDAPFSQSLAEKSKGPLIAKALGRLSSTKYSCSNRSSVGNLASSISSSASLASSWAVSRPCSLKFSMASETHRISVLTLPMCCIWARNASSSSNNRRWCSSGSSSDNAALCSRSWSIFP